MHHILKRKEEEEEEKLQKLQGVDLISLTGPPCFRPCQWNYILLDVQLIIFLSSLALWLLFQVAEHKYESIKSINVALENAILQLRHQVELGRSRQSRRRLITQQREDGSGGVLTSTSAFNAASSSSMMPASVPGFSTSPSSPPSFSSISGQSKMNLFNLFFYFFFYRLGGHQVHRNCACVSSSSSLYSVITGPLVD